MREVPETLAVTLQNMVGEAIERVADRTPYQDMRAHQPVIEWQYMWDAIPETYRVSSSLDNWILEQGECWILTDGARNRAWIVESAKGMHFARMDVYLIPRANPTKCFISPHESHLGPYVIPVKFSAPAL